MFLTLLLASGYFCCLLIIIANRLKSVGPDLDP